MSDFHTTAFENALNNARFLSKILARKPIFLARVITNFFRAVVLKQNRLRFMDVAVDYSCNLSCSHCSALPLMRQDDHRLTVEEYAGIAQRMRDEGCLVFHFTGGEPLLRKDLEEIIKAFKPRSSLISVQTNGFAATRKRLKSLYDAGVDMMAVSLDSGIPEEHDAFRRQSGAFAKALQALEWGAEAGLLTSISTCITHDNIRSEGLRRVIEIAKERGIDCQFNLAVPAGHWQGNFTAQLTKDDQEEVRRLLRENRHCRLDLYHNWWNIGCGTVKEKLYMTAYAEIMPCPFIQISLGDLRKEDITDIRARALKIPEFAEYHPVCLAAENPDFVAKCSCYSVPDDRLPVPYDKEPWIRTLLGLNSKT